MQPPRPIPLTEVSFGPEEQAAVARVLASGWVMQGPEVERFEADFAAAVGAPYACAVSSGTAALTLALHALGVGAGDEVITVSHSFVATAAAVVHMGARPVFVDIEPTTLGMDPARVEEAIGPRTRAILCVHQLGWPCDVRALAEIARRRGLLLVEDAACALGSEILMDGKWRRVGRPEGDAACFSFHPRKVVTTGDGGMITARDQALDARLRRLRNHDLGRFEEVAWNYRLTDMQAALGRVQLARLDVLVAARRRVAARYAELLDGIDGVVTPRERAWGRTNWQSYFVRLPGRDIAAVQRALDAVASTRPGIANIHAMPAYTAFAPQAPLVESERAAREGLMLPIFPSLTEPDQRRIAEALRSALATD
jgi:dTDP-4-amino-4,6-dideoxygalactose transaminase